MSSKQQELDLLVKQQQKNQLSSEQQHERQQISSKNQFRKPIKNPFSDQSQDSQSDIQNNVIQQQTNVKISSKPPMPVKTVLQQAQEAMKWDKNEQIQIQILSKLQGEGMKDKKIKQLASKYKSLKIICQKQKTLRKNLQIQLNSVIKVDPQLNKSLVNGKQKKSTQKQQNKQINCKNCQESEKKIMDFRLKNQNLKSELNKAMRVISRELGEDFNIDQVLNQQNGWKGRQQKIQKLKNKVKELEEKLSNNGINVSHMSGFTAAQSTNNAFNSTRTSALIAENKRKQFDNLKIQVEALKNQNEILQGKVKSLVSRKVILENEIKQVKMEFQKKRQLLIQKSNNDDKFIELLKNENDRLKKQEKVVTKIVYKQDNNMQVVQLKQQIQKLKNKLKANQMMKNQNSTKQLSNQKQQKRVSKDLNSVALNSQEPMASQPPRILSVQKKKQIQQQYLKGSSKYLGKMSTQEEQELYKNWKKGISKNNL